MLLIFLLITTAAYLVYKWSISTFDYFEKQGIPYRKPLPLIGSTIELFRRKKVFFESLEELYNEFESEKVSGLFEFRRPQVLLRDPKIIKQLTVKDFEYFTNHRAMLPENTNPLLSKSLFGLKGQKWKDMRATLSPAFTGSKMRQMFKLVSDVGFQTGETIKKEIASGKENQIEFKDFAMKFTVDIIGSCAFGIETNSFENPDNDFLKIAKKMASLASVKIVLKFIGYFLFPKVMKALEINILDKESSDFFEEAIFQTMKTRGREGIVRHDMINLLLQAKNGQLSHSKINEEKIVDGFATVEESNLGKLEVKTQWSDEELAAQCFIFFFAGFETVSQTMTFIGYELACNPDIQQRLYEEIVETNNKTNGKKIDYDQLQSMKYLDQVISETLRKWPPVLLMDRVCLKEYDLKYDDKLLKIEPSMVLLVYIWSIHRDPKYYPEPEKFDPDRFSDENKGKIDPDTYMPFGVGPRSCIGCRFALMEVKTLIYYLLLNFSFEVTEKTQIPIKFLKNPFIMKAEKGVWIELKPRN